MNEYYGGPLNGKTIRQIAREKAVIAVYQWLTVDASKEELKEYVHADEALLEGETQNSSVIEPD